MQKSKKNGYQKNDVIGKINEVKELLSEKTSQPISDHLSSDLIHLNPEDAQSLRNIEQNILKCKMRLADLELAIANLNKEKEQLFKLIAEQNNEFVATARKLAVKNGINPDGDPSNERWNLDSSAMVFQRVK